MSETYDEESYTGSEPDDMCGLSDYEDEGTDLDEMQFTFCKGSTTKLLERTTEINLNGQTNDDNDDQLNSTTSTNNLHGNSKSKLMFFGCATVLLLSSFLLLISFPLYYEQLSIDLNGDHNKTTIEQQQQHNIYGAILYITTFTTLLIIAITLIATWIYKWQLNIFKLPIPNDRLFSISTCCGLAGTFCTVSSYQRVSCHLQDPLKGAALVYSLVFYFFFCRKVMGLQKIFSATTAVVGLFISVDYGLCDEFRCRGSDLALSLITQSTGWQGHAVWTLLYLIGIGLWVLHLTMLEEYVISYPNPFKAVPTNTSLLSTISRMVSNEEPRLHKNSTEGRKSQREKPNILHLIVWIQIITYVVFLIFGWIDLISRSGSITDVHQHWSNTKNTIYCHFNIQTQVPEMHHNSIPDNNEAIKELLSNLTPNSVLYNKTVQHVNRNRRESHYQFHQSIHHDRTTGSEIRIDQHNNNSNTDKQIHTFIKHRKARIYRNKISRFLLEKSKHYRQHHTKGSGTAATDLNSLLADGEFIFEDLQCEYVKKYAWLVIIVYTIFVISAMQFLMISESAVFTVAIATSALPLVGIFWSLCELTTNPFDNTAELVWAPQVSGELICSLLGTPIVFLGIGLLTRSYFYDNTIILIQPFSKRYTTLKSDSA